MRNIGVERIVGYRRKPALRIASGLNPSRCRARARNTELSGGSGREQEAGASVADLCRRHGMSSASFYGSKAKYGAWTCPMPGGVEDARGKLARPERKTGAPGETRTPNPQIRSLVLYPIELRAHATRGSRRGGKLAATAGWCKIGNGEPRFRRRRRLRKMPGRCASCHSFAAALLPPRPGSPRGRRQAPLPERKRTRPRPSR